MFYSTRRKLALFAWLLAGSSACQGGPQPSGVTTAPLALGPIPLSSATGASVPTATSAPPVVLPTAPPSLKPGVIFREDFDGASVDATKWAIHEKSGVVRLKDGWLTVTSVAGEPEFPFVLCKANLIPDSGPWYFETHAQWFNTKNESMVSTLNLDVLPPSSPNDPGYVAPMIQFRLSWYKPTVNFRSESGQKDGQGQDETGKAFRYRVESYNDKQFLIYVDGKKVVEGESTRRPKSFWIGHYPNAPVPKADWLHWRVDYVESGVPESSSPPTPAPTGPAPQP